MSGLNPPKSYEIVNWLVSGPQEIPDNFKTHSTKLNSMVPYITEQLWLIPQATWYLNKHLNDLYNIPDPIDALKTLKKVFMFQGISKTKLYQPRFNFQPKIIDAIEQYEGYDEGNARARALMMNHFGIPTTKYFKEKATKASVKKNSSQEVNKDITRALEIKKENDNQKHLASIPKSSEAVFRNESDMCQELIDREELILFDVSLLKKRNQVLFIFIDKNNHKKYLVKPFVAKIYVSNQDCVINNDYIEDLDPNKFAGYIMTDIKMYTKLKYILNHSYKRVLNGGA